MRQSWIVFYQMSSVGKIRLLSNFRRRLVNLPGYKLEIVETIPLDGRPQATAEDG